MTGKLRTLLIGSTAAVGLAAGAASAQEITIGWTAWSDAEFVTRLAAEILQDRMGVEVELVQTDIAIQYQGLANGDIDVMMMSWQPGTHADYLNEVGTDVFSLGILYTRARLGWVIPDYIPADQLTSIADLADPAVAEQLEFSVQGIDPGAGLMRLSGEAIETYDLEGYELVSASGAAMTAALDRAISRDEWIVVTGWSPHWKFGAYELRYLEDPEGVLGSFERVHAMARQGFYQDNVEVAEFFTRMQIPIADLEGAMFEANESSYEDAVASFIDEHEDRIDYWVTGEL